MHLHLLTYSWHQYGFQHSDIDKSNFFTLSSFGVTHFLNEKPEFTELEQWKREHFLFNNIIKIHVFKKYRVWKSYKVMMCFDMMWAWASYIYFCSLIGLEGFCSVRENAEAFQTARRESFLDDSCFSDCSVQDSVFLHGPKDNEITQRFQRRTVYIRRIFHCPTGTARQGDGDLERILGWGCGYCACSVYRDS